MRWSARLEAIGLYEPKIPFVNLRNSRSATVLGVLDAAVEIAVGSTGAKACGINLDCALESQLRSARRPPSRT